VWLKDGRNQWEDARDAAERPVQAQLAHECKAFQRARSDLAVRNQDTERHGQVQA
jgi:hypothetical protein